MRDQSSASWALPTPDEGAVLSFHRDHLKALALLERMRYYARYYQRTYIHMETELLTAVTRYRRGGEWKSVSGGVGNLRIPVPALHFGGRSCGDDLLRQVKGMSGR
ncbi:MAG: hypothetical protein ACLTDS_05990 [Bianqueaceae bacterium]